MKRIQINILHCLFIILFSGIDCPSLFSQDNTTISRVDSVLASSDKWNNQKRNNLQHLFFLQKSKQIIGSTYGIDKGDEIFIWSLIDGKKDTLVHLRKGEWVETMDLSPDESKLAIFTNSLDKGDAVPFIGCYSLQEMKWKWKIEDIGFIEKITFSDGGSKVVALGEDYLFIFDTETGKIINRNPSIRKEYPAIGHVSSYVHFSPSGKYCVTWQKFEREDDYLDWLRRKGNRNATVWDVENSLPISIIDEQSRISSILFTPDEKRIIIGYKSGAIRTYSIQDKNFANEFIADSWDIWYLFGNQLGNYFGTFSHGGVKIWKYFSFEMVKEFKDVVNVKCPIWPGGINPMAFSNDGKYLAIERQGALFIYSTNDWKNLWHVDTE